ncbi:uncharacterized protein BX663DRAFT_500453 [Cokeromyces recurvatus]|uniref:uncharacterized protein n=1 Tax=Cokeromyces recurvatus TaxID=90255 RepID=UPI00221ED82B|nr:uncharacterized protein BX663DRAFT_500453 [Cokeromyces recurvatus]KAI7905642.1 hypothetical protein BX663DRAFT_500453 [Cokeromyces recurvatus]
MTVIRLYSLFYSGTHNIPKDDPCIFIVAPHANQFVDPGLVIISNPRRFSPLMAQSSFKRKVIGTVARSLKAIPVIRPQDLATRGNGHLVVNEDSFILNGKDTSFKTQVAPRDIIVISKALKYEVAEVRSDTELKLKTELTSEAKEHILLHSGAFKIIPHIDQSVLYEKVHERLNKNESLVIFPEGGSHDRSEMLPLKAGFAIMALSAMAENKDLNIKIVPVGLNYFHPHRFRSRAVVSYGTPISVEPELVEKYKKGGSDKHEAISKLLQEGHEGLKSVTVNAPDYNTLMTIATARRLYKTASDHKLTIDQVVELNRRFLLGYKYFEKDPRLIDLVQRIKAYNNTLKYFKLRDYQVASADYTTFSAAPTLLLRIIQFAFLAIFGFPSLLINSPIIIIAFVISQKKQEEALAGSFVKIAGRDVLATWKILVTLVGIPILYGFYSFLLFVYLWFNGYKHPFSLSLLVWVALPFIQYICVLVLERSIDIYMSLNPLFMSLFNPLGFAELCSTRELLSENITKFVDENGSIALSDFDNTKFDKLELHERVKSKQSSKEDEIKPSTIQKWLDDRHFFNFSNVSSSDLSDDEFS